MAALSLQPALQSRTAVQACCIAALPACLCACRQHSQLCSLQEGACEAAARTEHLSLWTAVSNLAAHAEQLSSLTSDECTTARNMAIGQKSRSGGGRGKALPAGQADGGTGCTVCIVLASWSESSSTSSGSSPRSPWPPEPSPWPPPPTGTGNHEVHQAHLQQALTTSSAPPLPAHA